MGENRIKQQTKVTETVTVLTKTPPKIEKTEEGYKYIFTDITNIHNEKKVDFNINVGG